MNIAISNLTWEQSEDELVKEILLDLKVPSIEIAPTKIWGDLNSVENQEIVDYKEHWNASGINIVAIQSLLFGRPDLVMFQDEDKRKETIDYLAEVIRIGSGLGAQAFVFGSPKNRFVGDMNHTKAWDIAIKFFHDLGEIAKKHSTTFCIEPNPNDYGCDFITSTEEGINLVKEVNHPNFLLHLDAAGMTLSEERIENSLESAAPYLKHFHISEPHLNMVQNGKVDHEKMVQSLKHIDYTNFVSIEMRPNLNDSNLTSVRKSLEFVQNIYI